MAHETLRADLLSIINRNNIAVNDLDKQIAALHMKRKRLVEHSKAAQEKLSSLNQFDDMIELIELEHRIVPMAGSTRRAYMSVSVVSLTRKAFDAMHTLSDVYVAVAIKIDKWGITRADIKRSKSQINHGFSRSGFEIIEAIDKFYIERSEYSKMQLAAGAAWHDEDMVRSGLKARIVQREDI